MDNANDLTQCHQLLLAAHKQSVELEQQATEATQQTNGRRCVAISGMVV